jgi:hypothetical protein
MQTSQDFKQNSEHSIDPLVLTVFAGDNGSTRFYEDAGNSDDYKDGKYAWTEISHSEPDDHTITVKVDPTQGSYPGMDSKRSYTIKLMNTWPAESVSWNGQTIPYDTEQDQKGWEYDGNKFATVIHIPESSVDQATEVTVHFEDSIHSDLLNGMRGNIKRLQSAMKVLNKLSKNQFMQHNWKGDVAPPADLVDLYQTGNRIQMKPESAKDELLNFHQKIDQVHNEVEQMQGDYKYIRQALNLLESMQR